jgi:succinate dehydrogenase hydrophobic anchor subunit
LLLSTPLTVREILRGQLLALKRQFLGPMVVVLTVFFIFMLASASEVSAADDRAAWLLFWAALMTLLVADVAGLYWVGMWQGLTARNPNRATGAALARIMVLPCIAFALLSMLVSLLSINREVDLGPKFFLVLWVGLSLAADVGFGTYARHKLLTEFRLAAAQRYAPGLGFWKRLLGGGRTSSPAAPPVIEMAKPSAPGVQSL